MREKTKARKIIGDRRQYAMIFEVTAIPDIGRDIMQTAYLSKFHPYR
jgi:hypothetical protein